MNDAVKWSLVLTFNLALVANGRVILRDENLDPLTATSTGPHRIKCDEARQFDELRLAIEWVPGVCMKLNKTSDKTCLSVDDEFIIHGLWPSMVNLTDPAYCCSRKFDLKNIQKLVPRLDKSWKNLYEEEGNGKFWSHEWYKHGSCAKSVHELDGQLNYFNWTINSFEKLPIKLWLKSVQVIPDSDTHYDLAKLRGAIQSKTGSKIYFNCKRSKSDAILTGLTVCFNPKSLKLTNCVRSDDSICGRSKIKFVSSRGTLNV